MDRNRINHTYIVSQAGVADFTTIQAAIDAAHARAPTEAAPWLVYVYPGFYDEQLTLYDFVNLQGIGPVVIANPGDVIVKTIATCRLQDLTFEADLRLISPAIRADVATASLTLRGVRYGRPDAVGQTFLALSAGAVTLEDCLIDAGFPSYPVIDQSGGTLAIWRSSLQASTLYATGTAVIKVGGMGASQEVSYSRLIANTSAALHALYFSSVPTASRWLHCAFHSGATAAAINNASGSSIAATFGHCAVNYARSGAFTGLNDVVVDSGV